MVLRRFLTALALAAIGCCWLAARAPAARAEPYGQFYRPQDTWNVLETKYFRIYYTQDTPKSAAYLRTLADSTFERLNQFYGYQPPTKIRVIIVGYTTFSNGFADSDHDRITIFTSTPDFHSRSRVPWFDNVFTHELAHILSLNTATHWWKRVPLVLGTGLARFQQAQTLIKLPIYGRNFPHWFAEGVAQFDTSLLGRDAFDENRGAFQRAAYEDRLMFPLEKLPFFGGEQWYNTGLSFLMYLEDRFGTGTVHRLFKDTGEHFDYLFDELFPRVLGIPLADLERDFRIVVAKRFDDHFAAVSGGRYDGKPLRFEHATAKYRDLEPEQRDQMREGFLGMPLRYLDGKLFFRQVGVVTYGDFSAKDGTLTNVKPLSPGSVVAPNSSDSYFVLKPERDDNPLIPTFFRPEFESQMLVLADTDGNTRTLLRESRLSEIDTCAARSELAGIYDDGDGSVKLALYKLSGFGTKAVAVRRDTLRFPLNELPFDEVRSPRYGPDCKKLYFSRRIGHDHDLFAYDLTTGALETIASEPAFELYPDPVRDGVYYVSSRDGTMNVYFKPYDDTAPRLVTQAITGHHHPIDTPDALVFGRLYGTGFQMHMQRHDEAPPPAAMIAVAEKDSPAPKPPLEGLLEDAYGYNPVSPKNLMPPSLVPLIDVEYDSARSWDGAVRIQAGVELYMQDEIARHVLLMRGYTGDQNSFLLDYDNSMLPVSFRVRAGWNDARGLWVYGGTGGRYEQITNDRWGFLWGSLRLPLNLFYTVSAVAETIRDVGVTTGARARQFDLGDPAYGRELFGGVLTYDGLDRRDPAFRERDINKRGYRQFTLAGYYGLERVHSTLARQDSTLRAGATPFFRGELNYSEFLALPALADGWFDQSLQFDLTLGYISADLDFFPFYGGGRLYSQAAPEYNASVGFSGYDFGSLRGETLANVGVRYRGPLARNLGWNIGPFFLNDVYFQVFTSWGNIWGYDPTGRRQRPFVDPASNGRYVLGDVGADLRLGHFIQQVESNVGTTLRLVYRLVPFSTCSDGSRNRSCIGPNGERGFMFYFIVGGGF
ncbi:MAG TPA: hypothetical protein VFG30_15220 [Polyangiales bacterium]|nr:hypothetical protein [Polyangiales bacterium]